jgi:hypothetical protein
VPRSAWSGARLFGRRYPGRVHAVDLLYLWTDRLLFWGLVALRVWAFVDCSFRNPKAFPAVDKLTKPAWLGILLLSGVLGTLASPPLYPISLVSAVVTLVYLADVRPAVREITSGN